MTPIFDEIITKSAFWVYTFVLTQNHIIKLRRSTLNRVFTRLRLFWFFIFRNSRPVFFFLTFTEVPQYKLPRCKFSLVISSLDISSIKTRANLPRFKGSRVCTIYLEVLILLGKIENSRKAKSFIVEGNINYIKFVTYSIETKEKVRTLFETREKRKLKIKSTGLIKYFKIHNVRCLSREHRLSLWNCVEKTFVYCLNPNKSRAVTIWIEAVESFKLKVLEKIW